jgi:hypothetical protein
MIAADARKVLAKEHALNVARMSIEQVAVTRRLLATAPEHLMTSAEKPLVDTIQSLLTVIEMLASAVLAAADTN